MEKKKNIFIKSNIGWTRLEVSDQESSGPPWAVMPLVEEEHNIFTRQWKMSARKLKQGTTKFYNCHMI